MASRALIRYPVGMIRHAPRHDRIAIDPALMLGKPVVCGTRITVEQILREFGAGMPVEEVLASHPRLTSDHTRATQASATDCEGSGGS
jgi:uncharacterized protein (DUF433 family)